MKRHNLGTPSSVSFQSMEINIFSGIQAKGDYTTPWENVSGENWQEVPRWWENGALIYLSYDYLKHT